MAEVCFSENHTDVLHRFHHLVNLLSPSLHTMTLASSPGYHALHVNPNTFFLTTMFHVVQHPSACAQLLIFIHRLQTNFGLSCPFASRVFHHPSACAPELAHSLFSSIVQRKFVSSHAKVPLQLFIHIPCCFCCFFRLDACT